MNKYCLVSFDIAKELNYNNQTDEYDKRFSQDKNNELAYIEEKYQSDITNLLNLNMSNTQLQKVKTIYDWLKIFPIIKWEDSGYMYTV